ncbi:MAG: bifunctional phosphoribosylaminoimidazolecarboxamide formyltransferase/IMP cyclohydrolase [Acidobacteriota bacterium]
MSGDKKIARALLSVTDKTGIVEFAQCLARHGAELVSTGGTARALREAGLTVREVADLTGFPEMLDGRVKTLHPKVHGGILYIRGNSEHREQAAAHHIEPIDMVVVNLYAFEKTAANPDAKFEDIIENIDIGGPAMVRSAAKNFEDVAIVTSVADYGHLADEMDLNRGMLSRETRWRLAQQAFATTGNYDTAIANVLERLEPTPRGLPLRTIDEFPQVLRISWPLAQSLRYGENPHQRAALYRDNSGEGIAAAQQLQGKELSYNNLVDLDACWELAQEFEEPACAIIKHTNPCGAATGSNLLEAYRKALVADPVSAFGGVIGVNREINGDTAEEMAALFVEAIAAPSFTEDAVMRFSAKKNLRLVVVRHAQTTRMLRQISGGMLMQDADNPKLSVADLKVATQRAPTEDELNALLFAWKVVKHVKSNAIVYARDGQTVGIGAGQMSRVDAARFGAMKAVLPLKGSVAASDAFFPFPDGLEVVAQAGATAVIQPGGSVKDKDVIAAADRLGLAMIFTGIRHFRH